MRLHVAEKRPARADSERELVSRAAKGDQYALAEIYIRHKRRIMSLCWRMVRNQAEAEDMVQDTFLQAFRKLHTFRGDSALSTWLHRIAVNLVLMKMRKRSIVEVPVDDRLAEDSDFGATEFGSDDNRLAGAIDRVDLDLALEDLAPGYRLVFVLHDVEGYEHPEIAAMLGCSTGCSKSQLHKARLRLLRHLKTGSRHLHEKVAA